MERQCVICHDRPADHQCRQCHKLVCDECAFKDDNGVFCCRDCAATFKSFKEDGAGAKAARKGGPVKSLVKLIVILVVLAIVAGAVYVLGAKQGWFGEAEKDRVTEGEKQIKEKIEDVRDE